MAGGNGRISGRWSGSAGAAALGVGHNSGRPTRGGHHFMPRKIFENEPMQPETRKVFEQGVTGPLHGGRHMNSKEHFVHTDAVYEHYRRFFRDNGTSSETMAPDQARKLLDEVKRSNDPRVRDLNLKIYRREIFFWVRRLGRGNE